MVHGSSGERRSRSVPAAGHGRRGSGAAARSRPGNTRQGSFTERSHVRDTSVTGAVYPPLVPDIATAQRILVVDDEADITALVAYHLAKEGYRVATASTGPEALKAAGSAPPDLIVLDLMLPGVSGYDVLQELRRQPETREVGVILLTARKEEVDRVKGLALGADDYVVKPFSPKEPLLRVAAV